MALGGAYLSSQCGLGRKWWTGGHGRSERVTTMVIRFQLYLLKQAILVLCYSS